MAPQKCPRRSIASSSLLQSVLALLLVLTVPVHQIPHRRLVMRASWYRHESAHVCVAREPATPRLQKVRRIFQHTRPCLAQRKMVFSAPPFPVVAVPLAALFIATAQRGAPAVSVPSRGTFGACAARLGRSPPLSHLLA